MGIDQEFEIAADAKLTNTVLPLSQNAQEVLAQRTDYQALLTQKKLYGLNVENIKGRAYPSLAGFGQYNYNAQRQEFNLFDGSKPWFKTFVLGVQLNVPIFDGFQRKNQVRQAELEVRKTDLTMQNLALNTQLSLNNAIEQVNTSQLAIQNQERNVDLAQEVYTTTNSLYKEGLSPLTDLLEAEVSLREAQTN